MSMTFSDFPGDEVAGGEKVVIALTVASVRQAGVFDTDLLYRIKVTAPNSSGILTLLSCARIPWPGLSASAGDDRRVGSLAPPAG